MPPVQPFLARLAPPVRGQGFSQVDHWVWCGSATRDPEGRYHLFAARWPRHLPFFEGYEVASEVVRAVADRPEGPYVFTEVILPDRGEDHWDGRMTHNPTVLAAGGKWYLFYIGSTYPGPRPPADALRDPDEALKDFIFKAYRRIRIGCAVAEHPAGPWRRPDAPCLDIRPDKWDCTVTTNPAPCLTPDGKVLLYYRSNTPKGCKLGVAIAEEPGGVFRRYRDEPILEQGSDRGIEDPFVWWNGSCYELIAKDLTGKIAGEHGNGVHAVSDDGVDFTLCDPPVAWRKELTWADGTVQKMGSFERPQLLLEDGVPTQVFCAMADGPGDFRNAENTWNQVIALVR